MIIGMDFGTTNSGMSVYDGHQLRFIPLEADSTVARTALYLTNDRQVSIGRAAIDAYYQQNLNRPARYESVRVGEITLTFAEVGTFVRDVYIERDIFAPGRLFLSFKTALSSLNYLGTVVGSHFYFLEDIVALYLYIARQRAEQFLDTEIRQIVLGRPVRFNFDPEADRLAQERLLKAAFRAGYETVSFQYEPIAAAYDYESRISAPQNVLIFDFGGGTLDISILRVGDPRQRAVLATGGVPIAGDIFDQKLVRAQLPRHFGEGSFYRLDGKLLPLPSSFYEAFSNWQDMLALQRPGFLEDLKRIERGAQHPKQIRALASLVSSSYGLKMYDVVEATKRQLSLLRQSAITLEGPGFYVRQPVTRAEFERIIRPEVRVIEEHLDETLQRAGLRADQIDAVIRTGGSSQIPIFIDMLAQRFGTERVRALDTFSSVTAGLGIIAHRISSGALDERLYHRRDYDLSQTVTDPSGMGVPPVDFEVMQRFIALRDVYTDARPALGLAALDGDYEVRAALIQPDQLGAGELPLDALGLPANPFHGALAAGPDDAILVATTDYRFLLRTARELASFNAMDLRLADAEGFATDVFGSEHAAALCPWHRLHDRAPIILITTAGYTREFRAGPLLERMNQPVAYQLDRLRGWPLTFLNLDSDADLLLFTAGGRALRLPAQLLLDAHNKRAMKVGTSDRIIAAWASAEPVDLLFASAEGHALRLNSADLPPAAALNDAGTRIFTRRGLTTVIPLIPGAPLRALTDRRFLTLAPPATESGRLLKLTRDERLMALFGPHA